MGLRVSFELDDDDLKHFRLIMQQARQTRALQSPESIVAGAEAMLAGLNKDVAPGFILERMHKLELMIRMLSDTDWRLPHDDAKRVLNALAYFSEPEDLIPDHIPCLGFLDDAIMIELVVRELRHEIDAYQDFCDFRDRVREEQGNDAPISREGWLEDRRKKLQTRMRRRRKNKASGKAEKRLRLFS